MPSINAPASGTTSPVKRAHKASLSTGEGRTPQAHARRIRKGWHQLAATEEPLAGAAAPSHSGPTAIAAIAAVHRRVCQLGSRLSIVLGNHAVTDALAHTGLLQQLQLAGPREVFFDWSR
jgi:hypothetical protein